MDMMSPTIGKLAEALAKAQGQIEGALKDSSNPFFKSNYADLYSVQQACKTPLCENGLSVVQITEIIQDKTCLITILTHASGEWIKSTLPLPVIKQDGQTIKQDAQSLGSALTYCRRYALSAIVGVSSKDDDGEAAVKHLREEKSKPVLIEGPSKKSEVKPPIPPIREVRLGECSAEMKLFIEETASSGNCPVEKVVKAANSSVENSQKFHDKFNVWKTFRTSP